ncbi:MAG TPA: CopG family transcriptional regulator [Candidatus Obscuribacterales bacterium]
MSKVRKQIYIEEWQDARLAELSAKSGMSEAEVIRQALDAYLLALDELPSQHPLSFLAAIGSSDKGSFGGSDHDDILYNR